MLLTQEVDIIISNNPKYYENLGYLVPMRKNKKGKFVLDNKTKLRVKVNDLPISSNTMLDFICDYCGEKYQRNYYKYLRGRKDNNKDCCFKCKTIKEKETNLIKYGFSNVFQNEDIKKTIRETLCQKYDVTNINSPSQIKEVQIKRKNTFINKYGVENPFQAKEVQDKIKESNKQKYGVEFSIQNESIKQKVIDKNKIPYSEIKNFIESNNCILITKETEYIDSQTNLKIQCACGNLFETKYVYFVHENKRQCNTCGIKSRSGENSPNWNGGISSERDKIKVTEEYQEWRKNVYKRDNYTCQCCGDNTGHNLNAHHIENFSDFPELRFDIDNGITLCDSCHNPNKYGSFHNIYGTKNNNKDQLEEYFRRFDNHEFD